MWASMAKVENDTSDLITSDGTQDTSAISSDDAGTAISEQISNEDEMLLENLDESMPPSEDAINAISELPTDDVSSITS